MVSVPIQPEGFQDWLARVRAGDQAAAAEMLDRYGPVLERMVRVRLSDPRLRKVVGASDICQSVLGSFFVRAALGQYELGGPEDLLRLLAVMVRNKLADKARKKDVERHAGAAVPIDDLPDLAAAGPSPSREIELRELVVKARARLSPEVQEVLALRADGLVWAEIAGMMGVSAEALRKRVTRATEAVARELDAV